jgi:hypothetical protein
MPAKQPSRGKPGQVPPRLDAQPSFAAEGDLVREGALKCEPARTAGDVNARRPTSGEVQEAIAALSNHGTAQSPENFMRAFPSPAYSGLYSWWADLEGRELLSRPLSMALPTLIYAGQAGATSARAGKQNEVTLARRIDGNHLRGNVRSSTLRYSLAALLRTDSDFAEDFVSPTTANEARLTAWICAHLGVVTYPFTDRGSLACLEREILAELNPPLNLEGMHPADTRRQLKSLRRRFAEGAPPPKATQFSTSRARAY